MDECKPLAEGAGGTVAGLVPDTYLSTATPHLGVGPFGYLGLIPSPLQRVVGRGLPSLTSELNLRTFGNASR